MRILLPAIVLLALSTAEARRDVVVRVRVPAPTYRVRVAPPVVREEVRVAAPSPRHVWVGGYWRWNGRRHLWIAGHWAVPPRGYRVWIGPRWVPEGGVYVFHPGYWAVDEVGVAPPVADEEMYADT